MLGNKEGISLFLILSTFERVHEIDSPQERQPTGPMYSLFLCLVEH